MQRKSVLKQMWDILSPLMLRYAVAYVIALLFLDEYREHPTEMGAVAAVLTVPFLILMVKKDKAKEREAGILPNKKAPLGKYVMIAGVSAALAIGLNNLLLLANLAKYSESYQEAAEALYAPAFLAQLLCVGIVYPILEEYMFRGVIYRRMRAISSPKKAIVMSSIFFGLYHGNLVQMIYGTVAGLMLAYVYEKYGSLKAPVLAHVIMNIVACVLTEMNGFAWMLAQPIRAAVITGVCIVLAFVILAQIQKIDEKPENV
ncbi:MAG: CPBP family intramembrane metalloprotease [Tyzzerella sp.]|nr:CPBP family intramembrane metalloprotease [Tyzzerella sp.]